MMKPLRTSLLVLIGVLLCWPAADAGAQAPPGTPLTLIAPVGRQTVSTEVVGGREMIALAEVATLFDVTIREDALAGGVTVAAGGQTIALSEGQALASVGGRIVALPGPVVRDNGRWLVPLEFLPRAIAPALGTTVALRPASRLLLVGDVRVPRVTVRVDGQQATIDLDTAVSIDPAIQGNQVVIRTDADGLDLPNGPVPGAGPIDGVRVEDPSTLVVSLGPDAATPTVAPAPGSPGTTRIVVDVPSAVVAAPAPPAPSPFPVPAPTPAPAPAATALAPRGPTLDVIVIDPGHGGDDAGVRGPGGTREADITLAVAQQLRTLIETRLGARVLLTREGDRTVLLDQRTAIANNNKAGLFLSLHTGGAFSPEVSGAEVLYVRLGREGEAARQRAASAAALPVLGGGSRTIDAIRWDLAQAPHVETSAQLARMLVEELARRVPMGPRPRRDAPLRLLMGTNMPAALVEIGYLTNAEQESLLRSGPYQATVAEALYDAIVRFRGYLEAGE